MLHLEEEGVVDHSAEMKRLREWVGDVPLTMRATLLVDHGQAEAQVNDYALRHGRDLIVVGVQHKRRVTVIGTTTATLTRHAPCPVLTVPGDLLVIEEPARERESRNHELPAAAAAPLY